MNAIPGGVEIMRDPEDVLDALQVPEALDIAEELRDIRWREMLLRSA